jgi:hypothetical protein
MRGTYQSILPHFDVLTAPGPIEPPEVGQMLGFSTSNFVLNPGMAAMRGLGDAVTNPPSTEAIPTEPVPADDGAISTGLALAIVGVVGYLSYEIGKAMAPSGSKKTTWGLVGVPVGLFTGPVGLGVMALVSNYGGRS